MNCFFVVLTILLLLVIINPVIALSTTEVETEAWLVGTSSKKLEMTESTDSWNGENFNDIASSIDEDELGILADDSITNDKGEARYNQYINFENKVNGERKGPCVSRIEAILSEGESKTYEMGGKDYQVTVTTITDVGTIYVKFNVNGAVTPSMVGGESMILDNALEIRIIDIISNEAGDVTQDLVKFYLEIDTICEGTPYTSGSGFVRLMEDDNDIVSDFLYFRAGEQIARYSLEFKTSFESDVENREGDNDPIGTYLGDYERNNLWILGKDYTILKARRVNSAGSSVELTLMGDAIMDLLKEESNKVYEYNGKEYLIGVVVITNSEPITVKIDVNGELLRSLKQGDTATLLDGTILGISEVLLSNGDNKSDYVEIVLGTSKIYLKDTNIRDRKSSSHLEYGSEKIDDTHIIITGNDDNGTFSIDTIELNMTADDDYFVAAGHSLTEYMDEPQAFLGSWDIMYQGLDSSMLMEKYRIKTSGSDQYNLEFIDGDGNQATFPILYTSGGSNAILGDNNDNLVLRGSMKIQKNDYLVVSDYSKEDGRRNTYALRYKGADKVATGETSIVKFDNMGTGKRIEQTFSDNSGENTADATLKLGGASFAVINASYAGSDDFDVWVDLDGDGNIQNDEDIVVINTNAGMKISLDNETIKDHILATFSTPNEDDYDNIIPTQVKLKLGAHNGKVYIEEADDSTISWVVPSEEPEIKYAYTSMGSKFTWENPLNYPDQLVIDYSVEQRLPLVYVVSRVVSYWEPLPPYKQLVQRVAALENRASLFDQWKVTIDNTINAMKQWIFFLGEGDVCTAIESNCGGKCVDDCNELDVGCLDEKTKWSCHLQNDGCYDKIGIICGEGFYCLDGVCYEEVQEIEEEVIFRTSVGNGNYNMCNARDNCWIAVDIDGDCVLDALGFELHGGICNGDVIGTTPEGYQIIDYGSSYRVSVCDPAGAAVTFSSLRSSNGIELSNEPKDPYKSNDQEAYGDCVG